jgi:hypothetical protein
VEPIAAMNIDSSPAFARHWPEAPDRKQGSCPQVALAWALDAARRSRRPFRPR